MLLYFTTIKKNVTLCANIFNKTLLVLAYSSRAQFYTNLMTSEYCQKCYFNLMVIFLLCLPNPTFLATLIALLSHPITLFQTKTLSLLFKKCSIPFPLKKNSANSSVCGDDLLFNIFQVSLQSVSRQKCRL